MASWTQGMGALANTTAIKKYGGLSASGDFADAASIWRSCCAWAFLPEGYVYPREQRGARDLARKRLQLVRYRTAQICRSRTRWRARPAPG